MIARPADVESLAAIAAEGGALADLGARNPDDVPVRRGAVLLLLAGETLETSSIVLEERSHLLRSQPGQFSLPGGGVEPGDVDDRSAALREAREEIGLQEQDVDVLGDFAAIAMPWRRYEVRPVLAWTPRRPPLVADPAEVARTVWVPLRGEGSLSDPAVRRQGILDGRDVGIAFDLPGESFVWGFTARILEGLLEILGPVTPPRGPAVEVPAVRRQEGSGSHPGPRPGTT